MRKEVSLAVIIGIILGAIILYGINLANQSTKDLPQTSKKIVSPTPTQISNPPSESTVTPNSITITSHTTNQVVFENKITITGKAKSSSQVAVVSNLNEEIIKTESDGSFSIEINLEAGENLISFSQPDAQKQNLETTTLSIIYSTKPIE